MWRCKWVELQVKKLRSQALKYDREVANHDQRKHYLLENLPLEGCGVKSLPYSNDGPTDKVMRRKKRRRLEDTTDVTSYMSHHNLFSYFGTNVYLFYWIDMIFYCYLCLLAMNLSIVISQKIGFALPMVLMWMKIMPVKVRLDLFTVSYTDECVL